MSFKNLIALLLLITVSSKNFAQDKKQFISPTNNGDIVMTWNKDTPESEMKDDVKALAENGITIKYSNVKRNVKNEITGLKVEYSDRMGSKGKMEVENTSPIGTIKFFKQGVTLGFGEPNSGNDALAGNSMLRGFGAEDLMKQFKFNNNGGDSQSFSFNFPDKIEFGDTVTRIQIQKDGKKPVVIENGEVVEGGEDYTPEELDQLKSEHKVESLNFDGTTAKMKEFDFRNQEGLDNFKKKMDELKTEMEQKFSTQKSQSKDQLELNKTTEDLLKAKEEMIKAKAELEQARKELENTKTTKSVLKTKKT